MRTFQRSCVILDKYWLIMWVGTGEAIISSSIQHQLLTPSLPKNKRWVSGKTEMSKTSHGIRRMDGIRQAQKYNMRWSTTKNNYHQPPHSEPLFDMVPIFYSWLYNRKHILFMHIMHLFPPIKIESYCTYFTTVFPCLHILSSFIHSRDFPCCSSRKYSPSASHVSGAMPGTV